MLRGSMESCAGRHHLLLITATFNRIIKRPLGACPLQARRTRDEGAALSIARCPSRPCAVDGRHAILVSVCGGQEARNLHSQLVFATCYNFAHSFLQCAKGSSGLLTRHSVFVTAFIECYFCRWFHRILSTIGSIEFYGCFHRNLSVVGSAEFHLESIS